MSEQGRIRYIGDGVYSFFDGNCVWLQTERDDGVMHQVALEPEVFDALCDFVDELNRERRAFPVKESNHER